jgi:hypothetical protein
VQQLLQAVQDLKAGLRLIRQPYSEAAAVRVHGLLKAAAPWGWSDPVPAAMASLQDDAVLRELLDLVNRYMQWLQPSLQQQPAAPAPHDGSTTTSTSHSRSRGLLPGVKVFGAEAPASVGCVAICVAFYTVVFSAAQAAGPQAVNTIRPLLVNRDTGG